MALRRCLLKLQPATATMQHAFQQEYGPKLHNSSPSFFSLIHTEAFASGRSSLVGRFVSVGGGRNLNESGGGIAWPTHVYEKHHTRFSSSHARTMEEEKQTSGSGEKKLVLYRAKWMQPLRLVVRLKIFQLCGVAALALPLAQYAEEGWLSVGTLAAVAAVVGGAGAASAALWWFSRRYVGEMALLTPDLRIVQLSVIDFWGHRQDLKYDIRNVVPSLKGMSNAELEKAANQVLVPLDVVGEHQFYLSLRHGRFLQKELLFQLLHGTLDLTKAQSFLNRQQMAAPDTKKVEVEIYSNRQKSSIF